MIIKILGSGCPNCKRLEQNTMEATKLLQIEAEIVKITSMDEIVDYGILKTPGLVFDEKVVSSGKVLSVEEVVTLLKQASY